LRQVFILLGATASLLGIVVVGLAVLSFFADSPPAQTDPPIPTPTGEARFQGEITYAEQLSPDSVTVRVVVTNIGTALGDAKCRFAVHMWAESDLWVDAYFYNVEPRKKGYDTQDVYFDGNYINVGELECS